MRFIGWLLGALLLIAAGWIGGPVAMASYRVATAFEPDAARRTIATALDDAHERADGVEPRMASMSYDEQAVRACGYEVETLLQDEKVPFRMSADWGMIVLNSRAGMERERTRRMERVGHYAESHQATTLAALTACLDSSFTSICRPWVNEMAEEADRANAKALAEWSEFIREQDLQIKCTFLDGAAARRGISKTAPAPKAAP